MCDGEGRAARQSRGRGGSRERGRARGQYGPRQQGGRAVSCRGCSSLPQGPRRHNSPLCQLCGNISAGTMRSPSGENTVNSRLFVQTRPPSPVLSRSPLSTLLNPLVLGVVSVPGAVPSSGVWEARSAPHQDIHRQQWARCGNNHCHPGARCPGTVGCGALRRPLTCRARSEEQVGLCQAETLEQKGLKMHEGSREKGADEFGWNTE